SPAIGCSVSVGIQRPISIARGLKGPWPGTESPLEQLGKLLQLVGLVLRQALAGLGVDLVAERPERPVLGGGSRGGLRGRELRAEVVRDLRVRGVGADEVAEAVEGDGDVHGRRVRRRSLVLVLDRGPDGQRLDIARRARRAWIVRAVAAIERVRKAGVGVGLRWIVRARQ